MMLDWITTWIRLQQDYLWFVAGIGWLYVGAIWWQSRKEGVLPGWVIWSAGAGVLMSVIEIATIVTVVSPVPGRPASPIGDMMLGGVMAVLGVGWWAVGLRGQRGRAVLVGSVGVIALFAALWRYDKPMEGTAMITIMILGAVAWWLFARESTEPEWKTPLVVCGLATLAATTGPMAYIVENTRRGWDASPLGPWAALAQMVAAAAVLFVWHRRRLAAGRTADDARVDRWFYAGAAAWLVVGLALAILAGNGGRQKFEQSILSRVTSAADLIPKSDLEVLLDDRLQVGKVETFYFPDGTTLLWTQSDHASKSAGPVTAQLARIAKPNPDIGSACIATLRDDWLLLAAQSIAPEKYYGTLSFFRRAQPEDRVAWENRQPLIDRPTSSHTAIHTLARAPIIGSDNQMLGWLTFFTQTSQWVAAQAQARSLAYLIVGLGLVVGRLLVTQRHRVRERDLAHEQASAATKASRLKTTFLANVSHELRTPLQTIMGYVDLLVPKMQAKERDQLLAMREHADLMGRLVNDLIDLSAAESGNFKLVERPVALVDQVVKTVESLRPRAEAKGLALSVGAAPEIPRWVSADAQRLRQVILNLVGNAVKYTEHGRVDVTLTLAGRGGDEIEVELQVADTGPGISPEDQKHLFAAFERLDLTAEHEGTGLGLAIVQAVCRAMHGSIRVESDGKHGSCFIARWRFALATAPAPATTTGTVPLRGKRILIADDNVLVRDLFVAFLTDCGAMCATAGDGEEALRRVHSESFDAIVLDLAMPKLDGLATVRRLRQEAPGKHWRVVGVSAHASGTEHQEALAAGMDAFLVKPVQLPELAQALSPEIKWIPPNRSFEQMRAHFEQRFRADAAAQRAAVARAWERGEWKEIHTAAHYLKNSADVVGDGDLARACASLEAAARARDYAAGTEAWRDCRHALERWVAEPLAN